MTPFNKYMLFYTGLQIIGVAGLMKLQEWEERNKGKSNYSK